MLHYVQCGNKNSKKALFFVHASGTDHRVFGEVKKYLKNYNCILIDLNGHGESKGECSTTVQGYIDNVADFIKNSEATKNQNDITIIGYSIGGSIVLGVALKKLPNVKKVVVISGTSKFDKFKDSEFMKKLHRNEIDNEFLTECFSTESTPLTRKYMQMFDPDPQVLITDLVGCENFDISNEIKNINIPVKIIIARDELLVPLEYAERDNSNIKNSILTIFESGRHGMVITKAKEVAKEIFCFVLD